MEVNYKNTLEHLQKMLRIHKFLRKICLIKMFCPFLKPTMPIVFFDDVQTFFDRNGKLMMEEPVSSIIYRYSMKWLDSDYAKIVFVSSECSVFDYF